MVGSCVFIIDDDPAILKGLKRLLSSEGFNVHTYLSARDFLDEYDPSIPGCIIIDLTLPDSNGLQLQRDLVAAAGEPAIIFLTGTADVPASVQAMKDGAIDFLIKPVEAEDLLQAVRVAVRKDQEMRKKRTEFNTLDERWNTLSPREQEVFEHVVRGKMNKQIALDLKVVEKTIKVHRARVIRKMGAQSLADLVRMSERLGMNSKTS